MTKIIMDRNLLLLLLLIFLKYSIAQIEKSSLTFVIDNTYSMKDDIRQVKESANKVFDAVLSSNASQIDNFILMIFNEPLGYPYYSTGTQLRAITKDRDVFKNALFGINLTSGGDCPEWAMSGIERALEVSLPGSYLYVFTDAAAKDYYLNDRVQSLAIKKKCQIVFLLTGKCSEFGNEAIQNQVYYKLSDATNGQVFNIEKQNVEEVINYIIESIKNRKTPIARVKFPPGYGHKLPIPVDDFTKEVVVAVAGTGRDVKITAPDGSEPKSELLVNTANVLIERIGDTKPGNYTATIGGTSETSVVVTGTTDIHFNHGFSVIKPTSIKDTATQPILGEKSHITVKLIALGNSTILDTVEILDPKDNSLLEIPVELIDEKEKLYTTAAVDLPYDLFKIAVKGHDTNTNKTFRRTGPTAIEPQKPSLVGITNHLPNIKIEQGDELKVEYNAPLKISCKVDAFPRPAITWEDEAGNILSSNVSTVELPYDYINILTIDKVTKNSTYKCKAANSVGENNRSIKIVTERKEYFDILQAPEDKVIEYGGKGSVKCRVDANPPAKIMWYFNETVVKTDGYIHLSSNKSILTIIDMRSHLVGSYICEARNEHNRKLMPFSLQINGLEMPKINKTNPEIHSLKGTSVTINCRLIQGKPRPKIAWYFKPSDSLEFEEIFENSDVLYLDSISFDQDGTYKCVATNEAGYDYFNTTVMVENAPTIEEAKSKISIMQGREVNLKCIANGSPEPKVQWFHNGARVISDTKYHILKDNSLRFTGSIENDGIFTCVASNPHGSARREVRVKFVVPVAIETPIETLLVQKEQRDLLIPCRADGYPKPNITWTFKSSDPEVPVKSIRSTDPSGFLAFKRLQFSDDGNYTCTASNGESSAKLTYQVKVLAPPKIHRVGPESFTVVKGDLVLQIPCNATGNPKPEVTWVKNGFNLATGTEWFDITDEGTLIFKNIDDTFSGKYKCYANSSLGSDDRTYTVKVNDYPDPPLVSEVLSVKAGSTVNLKCNIPHTRIDHVRWYKDNKSIPSGRLLNVDLTDSGVYVCRVSTFLDSRSGAVQVVAGYEPRFLNEDPEIEIYYEEHDSGFLDCKADGEPKPKIYWFFNENLMEKTDMLYEFDINIDRRGEYKCVVYNQFGRIERSFEILSRDCLLNLKTDLTKYHPLMVQSSSLSLPVFENIKGNLIIPKYEPLRLYCPNGFKDFPGNEVIVACDRETNFRVQGRIVKYSEITCNEELKTKIKRTGRRCQNENSELIKVGYEVYTKFIQVYEVCLDSAKNAPVFSKHRLHRSLSDIQTDIRPEFYNDDIIQLNTNAAYECRTQINSISSFIGRWFHLEDGCCFNKRQLVNPRDLPAGVPQQATYTSLNIIPHWSSCNTQNWEILEDKIRNFAKESNEDLLVWTGTSGQLALENTKRGFENISLYDNIRHSQAVPQYLWKVVQNPSSRSSLAIVQLNIPDLSMTEADYYVKCRDICKDVPWMSGVLWRNPVNGYTFCCQLDDFKRAFGYEGYFGYGNGNVLKYSSLVPELHSERW